MGDFESGSTVSKSTSQMVMLVGASMSLLATLAPFAVMGYSNYFSIQSLFWMFAQDQYGFRLVLIPPGAIFSMLPFLLIRLALPYQMVRYYRSKTTRMRTAVVAILSEAPFLAVYILQIAFSLIFGGMMFGISLPFPITMIVGLLLLWKLPAPEVTVPWEGADEPTPWWEESPEDKTEPTADNQPW